MFSTYSNFCNALFIKSYLDNKIDKVVFDGFDKDTFQAIRSIIGITDYEKKNIVSQQINPFQILLKNIIYFSKLIAINFTDSIKK